MENAPARALQRAGNIAGNRRQGRVQILEIGQRVQQPLGIGMRRVAEDLAHRACLDHTAQIHHRHLVGGLGDDAQIVGDEDDAHAELVHQVLHQVDHLGLDGDVQRRGRLVGDQQLRTGRQRHGDHRPLAHAAGQFEGVLLEARGGVGNSNPVEHLDRQVRCLAPGHVLVKLELLGHLVADGDGGREAGHRLLEDHRDGAAAHDLHLARRAQRHHIDRTVVEGQGDLGFVAIDRVVGVELHQRLGGDRLARAGLADQSHHFARFQIEGDIVDGGDQALVGMEPQCQIFNFQQRHFFVLA